MFVARACLQVPEPAETFNAPKPDEPQDTRPQPAGGGGLDPTAGMHQQLQPAAAAAGCAHHGGLDPMSIAGVQPQQLPHTLRGRHRQ